MDDQLYLQWNDYESNISSTFKDLRQENDFYDVTLACEDDKQLQAHKLVLASCSSFFKNILRKNHHQHPLLYLKGIKSKELTSLLEFVYVGEIHIGQGDLESFLLAAEDLKIKGLTQGPKTGQKDSNSKATKKRKEPGNHVPVVEANEDEEIQEVTEVKTESINALSAREDIVPEQEQHQDYGYWGYDESNSQDYNYDQENNPSGATRRTDSNTCNIEGDLFERVGNAWSCGICKKIISSRKRLIEHLVETHQMSESKVQFMISRR